MTVPEVPLLAPEASLPEVLQWAVRQAVLAPSELNTQPCRLIAYRQKDDA